jgi:hypothetical protein
MRRKKKEEEGERGRIQRPDETKGRKDEKREGERSAGKTRASAFCLESGWDEMPKDFRPSVC